MDLLLYRRLLEASTPVIVLDRFKMPATPAMRRGTVHERSVESAAINPFLGEGVLDNPHKCIYTYMNIYIYACIYIYMYIYVYTCAYIIR